MELDSAKAISGEAIGGEAIGGEVIKKKTTKIKKIIKCKCGKAKPFYNIKGEKKAICCSKCKDDNMIMVKGMKCKCNKSQPAYNFAGKKPEYCKECMTDGMISVLNHKRCKCGTLPTYNFPNKKPAICCKECKEDGMINVKDKKCNCGLAIPIYNYETEITPKYCKSCKLDNMIDIMNKKKLCGCDKKVRATFNFEGESLAICCSSCKKPDMVNVIDTKCLCKKAQPNFNFAGQKKPICCIKCKKEGMIDIRNLNKMCQCGKARANFNIEGSTNAICCADCKTDDMEDVMHNKCIGINGICPLKQRGTSKYNNYCTACFQQNFPNDPLTPLIRKKTKEIEVRDFINTIYKDFVHDTPLWTGNCDCTIRRRIDHRKLIDNTLLVVETDENQHKSYNQMNEEIRYDDLFMAYSGKWIYIRFNPDIFTNKKGIKINPNISDRLIILNKELDKQIKKINEEKNNELLEIIYLFYDGYDY